MSSPVLATGVSTLQADGAPVAWLSKGLQALQLVVPFQSLVPIDPIKGIEIGELGLVFSERDPWAPVARSDSVQARLGSWFFGFSVGFYLEVG